MEALLAFSNPPGVHHVNSHWNLPYLQELTSRYETCCVFLLLFFTLEYVATICLCTVLVVGGILSLPEMVTWMDVEMSPGKGKEMSPELTSTKWWVANG